MKIAIVGNMNNLGFSLLRYFRDSGEDAYLLLNKNDGISSLSDFSVEKDSSSSETWKDFIVRTPYHNSSLVLLPQFLLKILSACLILTRKSHCFDQDIHLINPKSISEVFSGFDKYVTSGSNVGLLSMANIQVDIFFPYSLGVEFTKFHETRNGSYLKSLLYSVILRFVHTRQEKGIRNSINVLNFEFGPTRKALNLLKIGHIPLAIPMPYRKKNSRNEDFTESSLHLQLKRISENYELIFLHSARLHWVKPLGYSKKKWEQSNKNNNEFIMAFAETALNNPKVTSHLIIMEFGKDIVATKRLIQKLGIEEFVTWLPAISREDLFRVIDVANVCVGEFYEMPNTSWSGTAWEALASGRPVIQGFNFIPGEFEALSGNPIPPFIQVNKEQSFRHAVDFCFSIKRKTLEEIGKSSRAWYQQYGGNSLSVKWLELLRTDHPNSQSSAKGYPG